VNVIEEPVVITAGRGPRIGIVARAARVANRAVLIMPAPGETRTGPGRLYVRLARALAGGGLPSMRFDAPDGGDCQPDERGRPAVDDDAVDAARQLLALHPDSRIAVLAVGRGAVGAARAWRELNRAGVPLSTLCLVDPALGLPVPERKVGWWRRHFGRPARPPAEPRLGSATGSVVEGSDIELWTSLPAEVRAARARLLVVTRSAIRSHDGFATLARGERAWRKTLERPRSCLQLEGADPGFAQPAHWRKLTGWLATHLAH